MKDFGEDVAIHGVFMDMVTASRDAKIVHVAKERILHNIEVAKQLEAEMVTFCSCFNPCIKVAGYAEGYKQRQIKFWSKLLESIADHTITLVFENLWEPQPGLVKEILDVSTPKILKHY